MKIKDLKTTGSNSTVPCELVDRFALNADYMEFLKEFDFEDAEDVAEGYRHLCNTVYRDEFCRTKTNRDSNPDIMLIYTQCKAIVQNVQPNKIYTAVGEMLWLSHFERQNMKDNFKKFYSVEPKQDLYDKAVISMRKWWGYSEADIESLRYIICQAKMGHKFPAKLQRAVYIWSEQQFTGKTTVAEMFVMCLNGESNTDNIENFKSDIPHEWQFERFAVPKSMHKRAILLDEAFSGKNGTDNYYPRIKSELTSRTCNYEVKGGGFFSSKCYRNYFITSNHPPEKFIHDRSERRFFVINMKNRPPILSDDKIMSVIRDFCQNATPETDLAMWYRNTMPNVIGSIGRKEEEYANAFLSDNFRSMLQNYRDAEKLTVDRSPKRNLYFPSEFKRWIFNEAGIVKNDKNAESVEPSVIKAFGAPKQLKGGQKYYNISALIAIIDEANKGLHVADDVQNEPFVMPF